MTLLTSIERLRIIANGTSSASITPQQARFILTAFKRRESTNAQRVENVQKAVDSTVARIDALIADTNTRPNVLARLQAERQRLVRLRPEQAQDI